MNEKNAENLYLRTKITFNCILELAKILEDHSKDCGDSFKNFTEFIVRNLLFLVEQDNLFYFNIYIDLCRDLLIESKFYDFESYKEARNNQILNFDLTVLFSKLSTYDSAYDLFCKDFIYILNGLAEVFDDLKVTSFINKLIEKISTYSKKKVRESDFSSSNDYFQHNYAPLYNRSSNIVISNSVDIEVVDFGWSILGEKKNILSFGMKLKNSNKTRKLTHGEIVLNIFDDKGFIIKNIYFRIPSIMPQSEIYAGQTLYLESTISNDKIKSIKYNKRYFSFDEVISKKDFCLAKELDSKNCNIVVDKTHSSICFSIDEQDIASKSSTLNLYIIFKNENGAIVGGYHNLLQDCCFLEKQTKINVKVPIELIDFKIEGYLLD